MKVGYSFEGLVNRVAAVDESAVHKTGDETVAGLKTFTSCPASSGVQGAAGTHLTRRDFVLAELNKKVDLTGAQTIGGAKTFSSDLTAPAFLSSAAQNTAANAATRKDYVDAEVAKQVSKTGDTMTGNLTAPAVLVSSAQNTSVNALTRKDYVDSAIDTKASNRVNFATELGISRVITGATLPSHAGVWGVRNSTWTPAGYGSLYVTTNRADELTTAGQGSFIHYLFISHNNARIYSATNVNGSFSGWRLTDADSVNKSGDTMSGPLTVNAPLTIGSLSSQQLTTLHGELQIQAGNYGCRAITAEGRGYFQAGNAVDTTQPHLMTLSGWVATPLTSLEIKLKGGSIWFNSDSNIVADAAPTASNHLVNKAYADTKVSLAGDTMTGNLTISNASPIFTLNETDTGKKWLLVADGNGCRFQMDSTNGREAWAVNSNGTVGIYDPTSTAAQGGLAGSLTRKDYVDGQVATRAPTSHTHTAEQGNSNVVQGQHSVVGSYIFATLKPTAGSIANPGTNVSGVNLHPCGAGQYTENRAWVLAGTWMCMGAFNAGNSDDAWDDRATLWFRVA